MANVKLSSFLRYWLPVGIWMTVIFSASADTQSYVHSSLIFEPVMRWLFPHMPKEQMEELHHLFRKCGHLSEYGILALLVWRAIHKPCLEPGKPWSWSEAGLTVVIVCGYAATDEFHQIFVPNRTPLVSDVIIDTLGGSAALLCLWAMRRLRPARKT